MAIEINVQRDAVEILWEPTLSPSYGTGKDEVVVRCTSPNDVSLTSARPNSGHTPVTYPKGYVGETHVEIMDLDGNVFETGDIFVGPKPNPYEDVVRAAWALHQYIWFTGEAVPWPEGYEELTVLDGILSDALSRIPPIDENE